MDIITSCFDDRLNPKSCVFLVGCCTVGHVINGMIRTALDTGDVDIRESVEHHMRETCGVKHFQFKEAAVCGGPDWEDGGSYRWMSMTGVQLDSVRSPLS